ncbi:MAG: hypothetical protein K6B28_10275 [Lachnospiraceae bacterium]|nr:hypothetical protein [Lachnospiraceae bacterium]
MMKNCLKRILITVLTFVLLILAGCHNKPNTQKEVEEYVAANVPEESELIDHYEQQTNNGTEYVYVFRSKSRDLEFYAFSTIGGSSLTGYHISEYYKNGLENYYLKKMRPILIECTNSEMSVKPDAETVSRNLYLKDETDAKYLAPFLAKCNDIVKEEFEYQPGADLSQKDVLGLYFFIYPSAGSKEKLGFYYLNGKDDEDAVYQKLIKLLE